jgi:hypothetical protein
VWGIERAAGRLNDHGGPDRYREPVLKELTHRFGATAYNRTLSQTQKQCCPRRRSHV